MKIRILEKAMPELMNKVEMKSDNLHVRIYVKTFGWGGPVFGVSLDEKHDDDYLETQEGISFIVDNELINRYKGFEIDFTSSWYSKGFVVQTSSGPVSKC